MCTRVFTFCSLDALCIELELGYADCQLADSSSLSVSGVVSSSLSVFDHADTVFEVLEAWGDDGFDEGPRMGGAKIAQAAADWRIPLAGEDRPREGSRPGPCFDLLRSALQITAIILLRFYTATFSCSLPLRNVAQSGMHSLPPTCV